MRNSVKRYKKHIKNSVFSSAHRSLVLCRAPEQLSMDSPKPRSALSLEESTLHLSNGISSSVSQL